MQIRFWGVRGTIPTPGPGTVRLGGNTPCIEVRTADNHLIIIDAGSGIRRLGISLNQEYPEQIEGTILISHTHWDHIQGFPYFAPLVDKSGRNNKFFVIGQKRMGRQLESILAGTIIEPYLPFVYHELSAEIDFHEVLAGEVVALPNKTYVKVAELRHPGGCLGFRIEDEDKIFTYCTDTSHRVDQLTEGVLELAQGADVLVHDAQYTLEQRQKFPDYGHSSWAEAAQVAKTAQVKKLVLFHYDPDATDDMMATILEKTKGIFPNTILAKEDLMLLIPDD
jgi:phosphoribosyl 1,2-cyclic phosphodiesterase